MSTHRTTRAQVLRAGVGTFAVASLACTPQHRTRIIVSSDHVSLVASGVRDERTLRLDAAPGARINARLPPALVLSDSTRFIFTSTSLTADSSYFTDSPTASVSTARAKSGTLFASVCPAELLVCLSVKLDVRLP